jgi:predicted MPP superfamily phosphohydrolase
MLAVLGNHEHWAGLRKIRAKYDEVKRNQGPLRLLVDESVLLEHNGTTIRVVGTDFPNRSLDQSRAEVMRRQAESAFVDARPDETTICLAHHPDFFPHAAGKGAKLTLSGHTHGGQVALLGIPAFGFVFKYMLGRYRAAESHLYVSGGTGHWLPFRIGVPAEVSILTLRSA